MARFSARALYASEYLAVDYYAAAHARAESDEYQIVIALAAAEAIFAERRDIGVVVDEYRRLVILSHLFAHMYILHGDIVPVSYYAALGVYRARLSYAYAFQILLVDTRALY